MAEQQLVAIWIQTTTKAFQMVQEQGAGPPNLRLEIDAGFDSQFDWVYSQRSRGYEWVGPNRLRQSQPVTRDNPLTRHKSARFVYYPADKIGWNKPEDRSVFLGFVDQRTTRLTLKADSGRVQWLPESLLIGSIVTSRPRGRSSLYRQDFEIVNWPQDSMLAENEAVLLEDVKRLSVR